MMVDFDERDDYDPAYRFRNFSIPKYMMDGILQYVNAGVPPGSFLSAVICNNLQDAVGQADDFNIKNIPAYVAYFYNEVPSPAWGSPEKMREWMGRFIGLCAVCGESTWNHGIELGKIVFMCKDCRAKEEKHGS